MMPHLAIISELDAGAIHTITVDATHLWHWFNETIQHLVVAVICPAFVLQQSISACLYGSPLIWSQTPLADSGSVHRFELS